MCHFEHRLSKLFQMGFWAFSMSSPALPLLLSAHRNFSDFPNEKRASWAFIFWSDHAFRSSLFRLSRTIYNIEFSLLWRPLCFFPVILPELVISLFLLFVCLIFFFCSRLFSVFQFRCFVPTWNTVQQMGTHTKNKYRPHISNDKVHTFIATWRLLNNA